MFTEEEKNFIKSFNLDYRGAGRRRRYVHTSMGHTNYKLESYTKANVNIIEEETLLFEISREEFEYLVKEMFALMNRNDKFTHIHQYILEQDVEDFRNDKLKEKYPAVKDTYEQYQAMLALVQSDNDLD